MLISKPTGFKANATHSYRQPRVGNWRFAHLVTNTGNKGRISGFHIRTTPYPVFHNGNSNVSTGGHNPLSKLGTASL